MDSITITITGANGTREFELTKKQLDAFSNVVINPDAGYHHQQKADFEPARAAWLLAALNATRIPDAAPARRTRKRR